MVALDPLYNQIKSNSSTLNNNIQFGGLIKVLFFYVLIFYFNRMVYWFCFELVFDEH